MTPWKFGYRTALSLSTRMFIKKLDVERIILGITLKYHKTNTRCFTVYNVPMHLKIKQPVHITGGNIRFWNVDIFSEIIVNKLSVKQRSIARTNLNISLKDRKITEWIREETKVTDISERVERLKRNWPATQSENKRGGVTRS